MRVGISSLYCEKVFSLATTTPFPTTFWKILVTLFRFETVLFALQSEEQNDDIFIFVGSSK